MQHQTFSDKSMQTCSSDSITMKNRVRLKLNTFLNPNVDVDFLDNDKHAFVHQIPWGARTVPNLVMLFFPKLPIGFLLVCLKMGHISHPVNINCNDEQNDNPFDFFPHFFSDWLAGNSPMCRSFFAPFLNSKLNHQKVHSLWILDLTWLFSQEHGFFTMEPRMF